MCEHKFVYKRTESWWQIEGRNSRSYHQIDYYFCEKCLEGKEVKKYHSCYDSDRDYNLPDWCKGINNKRYTSLEDRIW